MALSEEQKAKMKAGAAAKRAAAKKAAEAKVPALCKEISAQITINTAVRGASAGQRISALDASNTLLRRALAALSK